MQHSQIKRIRQRHPLFNWFFKQIKISWLLKTCLVLGIGFGLIPGSWIIGIPLLIIYGVVKFYLNKETWLPKIANYFKRFSIVRAIVKLRKAKKAKLEKHKALLAKKLQPDQFSIEQRTLDADYKKDRLRIRNRLIRNMGQSISQWLISRRYKFLKQIFAIYLIFSTTSIFSFLAIYGFYRYPFKSWKKDLKDKLNFLYEFFVGFQQGATQKLSFKARLGIFTAIALVTSIFLSMHGFFAVFDFLLSLLQLTMIAVGFKAILQDIGQMLRRPIKSFTKNPGKIYGVFWGRLLAYLIFPGRVIGSLGPAYGTVENQGIFSGILPALFGTSQSWFIFQTAFTTFFTSRIFQVLNSMLTSVFFSQSMTLAGEFSGIVGPTSFQIYFGMLFGCFFGWCLERIMDRFFRCAEQDAKLVCNKFTPPAQRGLNWVHRWRWEIAFITGMTPLVLSSAGGAGILALTGGNIVAASVLTAMATTLSVTALYKAGNSVKRSLGRVWNKIRSRGSQPDLQNSLAPSVDSQPLLEPNLDQEQPLFQQPTFTPQFNQDAAPIPAQDAVLPESENNVAGPSLHQGV